MTSLAALTLAATVFSQSVRGPVVPPGGFRAAAWAPVLIEELPSVFGGLTGSEIRRLEPFIDGLRAGGIVSPEQLQAMPLEARRKAFGAALAHAAERSSARFMSLASGVLSPRQKYELAQDLLFESRDYLKPEQRSFLEGALPRLMAEAAKQAPSPLVQRGHAAAERGADAAAGWKGAEPEEPVDPPEGLLWAYRGPYSGGQNDPADPADLERWALGSLRLHAGGGRSDVFWRRFARAESELAPYGGPSQAFLNEVTELKVDHGIRAGKAERIERFRMPMDPDDVSYLDHHYEAPRREVDRLSTDGTYSRVLALVAARRLTALGRPAHIRSRFSLGAEQRHGEARLEAAMSVTTYLLNRLELARSLSERDENPAALAAEARAIRLGEAPFPAAARLKEIAAEVEAELASVLKTWRLGAFLCAIFPSFLAGSAWALGLAGTLGWILAVPAAGALLALGFMGRAAWSYVRARRLTRLAAQLS